MTVRTIGGRARTGPRGFYHFSLDVIPGLTLDENLSTVSVVATPTENGPCEVAPRPLYIVAKVDGKSVGFWSFTAAGEWAPEVEFSWQCTVQA